ncbi:MAG: YihY/virulence factor BrkB family protein [Clostridia bacterium]|nr:YihY/virulence factor BrkB family protein [Clostridia bacterium]
MQFFRKSYAFIKEKYDLLVAKKYTTLAGTLVFFFIMSVVPLTFWLTLLVGKLPLPTERIFSLGVFQSVRNVFSYLQREAKNATASVSVLLLVTTLYSSTNLFYQMRRSGELIYAYSRGRSGWRVRLGALALTGIVTCLCVAFFVLLAIGSFLFSRFLSPTMERIADYVLLIALSFCLVLLLNAYVCPYKRPLKSFLKGTVITVATWVVAVTGFALYLKIGNVGKLYGALSAVIVFLLWLYVLMLCFIAGVIFNSETQVCQNPKKKKTHKRKA